MHVSFVAKYGWQETAFGYKPLSAKDFPEFMNNQG